MTVCSLLLCWFSLARCSASRALALPQAAHSPAGASPFPRTAHLLPPGPGRGHSAGADPSWGSFQRSCKLPGKVPGPSGALQAQCLSSLYSYSQVLPLPVPQQMNFFTEVHNLQHYPFHKKECTMLGFLNLCP